MASRAELIDVVGGDSVDTLDYRQALDMGLAEEDALVLSHVGLPRQVGAVFTTQVQDSPPLFAVRNFSDDGANRAVILGGPRDDPTMRYFLNVRERFVGLIVFADEPRGEVVNSTLADFVEFIYQLARRDVTPAPATKAARVEDAVRLTETLIDRDPHAFSESDMWWSIALRQIREHEEES